MAANGIYQTILTTLRGRKILGGSFVTATTSTPTSQRGDGVAAHSATGIWTVTLARKYSVCESVVATLDNTASGDNIVVEATYAAATGVITFGCQDISTTQLADSTGLRLNWMAIMSDRSS
jgi:hypothetical protein